MSRLQSITTRQYRVFLHLLKVKSVTETAHHFETSQPAVSRLLAEMRERFSDGLLVRSGERMVITDRGRIIRDELQAILDRLSDLIEPEPEFDPQTSETEFSLGFADSNMVSLVPPVVAAISHAGPGLKARVRPIDDSVDVLSALEERELDVVVDCVTEFTRDTYENLRYAPIGTDEIVLLARSDHPVVARPPQTAEDYLALEHIAPFPVSNFEKGPIDGSLKSLKTPRRISWFIPEYSLIPNVLLDSDLVFTTCRRFADVYANILPLSIVDAPGFFPRMEFRLLWHDVTNQNPSAIWLRDTIIRAAKIGNLQV
ncbi:LysR family transcriptional regulator [Oricola indica]|jgi:DNA-binding transcriptional LysR family regulator|uniref:LysR family transcriptional regulator n=1 Tax=Oricola indica TaxID=2872591 RepID=UPI001CC01C86|nr:LysR family transcriptional regulator [Oricola indica]